MSHILYVYMLTTHYTPTNTHPHKHAHKHTHTTHMPTNTYTKLVYSSIVDS